MTDLVKRLRELATDQDMLAPDNMNDSAELREAADRIEALEAALREIACTNDPDDPCTCQCQTECSYGIARIALAGQKKE